MGAVMSQITSLTIVYSNVYSGADKRKHQSSASLAFVRGNSPVTGEFPAQRASNAENVSIWWRHHDFLCIVSKVNLWEKRLHRYQGPSVSVGCNYLSLPLISGSDTHVLICNALSSYLWPNWNDVMISCFQDADCLASYDADGNVGKYTGIDALHPAAVCSEQNTIGCRFNFFVYTFLSDIIGLYRKWVLLYLWLLISLSYESCFYELSTTLTIVVRLASKLACDGLHYAPFWL